MTSDSYLLGVHSLSYYGSWMPKLALTLRLSPAQTKTIEQLSHKLGIDKTNVIRLAITRLAESEGIFNNLDAKRKP